MKKTIKKIALVVFSLAFVVVGVIFGPEIYKRLYEDNGLWISQKFSEKLEKTSELKVFEYTETGMKKYEKGFELFGKKVVTREIQYPYTFYMDYTVDLTNAVVIVQDKVIRIMVPSPEVNTHHVLIAEEDIKQSGLASLLSTSEITGHINEIQNQLYTDNADREDLRQQAWEGTEEALQSLFATLLEGEPFYGQYTLEVVMDESLAVTDEPTEQPAQ